MEDPKAFMDKLSHRFTLKEGGIEEPTLYRGRADAMKWYIAESEEPGKVRWAMASTQYTKQAIGDLEMELNAIKKRWPTKVTTCLRVSIVRNRIKHPN